MTLDERLEALVQSVELLAHQGADSEARLSAAEERQIAVEERVSAAKERQIAAEERLSAAKERQIAAEERLSAVEERQIAAEERRIAAEERLIAAEERHDLEMLEIRREARAMRSDLRRAFALGVQEARNELRRSAALDEKITQLAAAQLITEEKLQAFIDTLRRGANGNPPSH